MKYLLITESKAVNLSEVGIKTILEELQINYRIQNVTEEDNAYKVIFKVENFDIFVSKDEKCLVFDGENVIMKTLIYKFKTELSPNNTLHFVNESYEFHIKINDTTSMENLLF